MSNSINGTNGLQGRADAPGRQRAPGQRRKIQDEILNPSPVTPAPPAPAPAPVTPTNDLRTLAARYVAQYEQQGGRALSTTEREGLIQNVYDFYSQPSRGGRLEKIVVA